jgi:EAL domain-containing protein (putative c-di-GMP-specific phosphodiesterase class I)
MNIITEPVVQRVLVVDDDDSARAGVCALLETPGRSITACRDREAAELILQNQEVDVVIADVRLADSFNYDGLYIVDAASRLASRPLIVSITGEANPKLRAEAARRGASALLEKPMTSTEMENVIGTPSYGADAEVREVPTMQSVLRGGSLRTVFLPILRASGPEVFGYEALTRLDGGTPFDNPELLFAYAEKKNALVELELQCMENAFRDGATLPPGSALFINLHPGVLSGGVHFARNVRERAARWSMPLDRVVFEITEQAKLENVEAWLGDVESLRADGVRFAFDDFGVAYSHLLQIETMRPSFIKLSMWCGQSLDSDPAKQKIVRNTIALAQEFDSRVIVEGMETPHSVDAATNLGVDFLQGFHFGRPLPAAAFA